ncbi:hypothetical protein GpartN1_g3605.t1 [Galdieria partita]|uniref:Uncharacterized protein n=1 Tax=Galdieria partita TaxID=83374 RepID=A0A9C7UQC3_9RHOD|nr:hypothetical protein GpartN1_g3605.t1 [Galdieria partita]
MKLASVLRYAPVQVSLRYQLPLPIDNHNVIGGLRLEAYRMNLLAMNKKGDQLYVAYGEHVLLFQFSERQSPVFQRELSVAPDTINMIKYAELAATGPILVAACGNPVVETGAAVIYFLDVSTASLVGQERVIFTMSCSVWGISICEKNGLIALSSNDHCISVIRICLESEWGPQNRFFIVPSACRGHQHNIPSIDFSAYGRFIASASIDETMRVWDLTTGQSVGFSEGCRMEREEDKWGWAVKWLPLESVKIIEREDPLYSYFFETTNTFMQPLLSNYNEEEEHSTTQVYSRRRRQTVRLQNEQIQSIPQILLHSDCLLTDDSEQGGLMLLLQEIGLSLQDLQAMKEENRNDKLLVFSQRNFLHLLRGGDLYQLVFLPQVAPLNNSGSLMRRGMFRLNLLDYAPELSLLAVGNQGIGTVSLCRLVRSRLGEFRIIIEDILPQRAIVEDEQVPLAGLCFRKGDSYSKFCPYYQLVLVYLNGVLQAYEIERRTETSPLDISACSL